jgi:hypothetical protein
MTLSRRISAQKSSSVLTEQPSFNCRNLEADIEGNIVADFPLCNKSCNCSYSGSTARRSENSVRKLGRSLAIREVDAGSCNACELEIHALNNAF